MEGLIPRDKHSRWRDVVLDSKAPTDNKEPCEIYQSFFIPINAEENNPIRLTYDDRSLQNESTRSFGDAIDASRGMTAMSQNATPRNIYGPQGRVEGGAGDSYGFPITRSADSLTSPTSNYPSYFGGPINSSVSDYSKAGSDIESVLLRTVPSGRLHGGIIPAPQSMLGKFSTKGSSQPQGKHQCKICDKQFTRSSSLQTHMYSHTGEKRKLDSLSNLFNIYTNSE
jgi:hypothetical protein